MMPGLLSTRGQRGRSIDSGSSLACDPVALHIPHYCYVVQQPLSFEACKIAAWFGQPGGGMQYFSNKNAEGLASAGLIRQVRCR